MSISLFPVALKLEGRRVLVVGGGPVASRKTRALLEAGARVRLVAPELEQELCHPQLEVHRRGFDTSDLADCWLVVSAATAEVNRRVAEAATARRIFVIAVDDVRNCTAYGSAVVRRAGVTLGISTDGTAPALTRLLREGLERLLPDDLDRWTALARSLREDWRRRDIPLAERRPLLLRALNDLYRERLSEPGRPSPEATARREPESRA